MLINNSNINILIQDGAGYTIYHHAIKENASEEIIKLLDEKIDEPIYKLKIYNIQNIEGYTILHLLLEYNIQINYHRQ
jgi:ankyrin repeat protein